jgi:hypothetical protein
VTSSFELRLKSILQTCSNRQRVSLVTAIRGKRKRAHLTARINLLQQITRKGVPETKLLVGCSSSARENAVLMRVPGDGFDSGDVVGEAMERLLRFKRGQLRKRERKEKRQTSFILSKTKSLLSFPPLASCPSALHLRPQTSCL